MRDRLNGYSSAQLDQLTVRMFFEWPSESFVARQLGLGERDVEAALMRFTTKVAMLANEHWYTRLLRQLDELVLCCDRLSEVEDPPRISVALRVRLAALRQSFIGAAGTSTPAPMPAPAPAPAVPDVVTARPPGRRVRRFDVAPTQRAGELAVAE